MKTSASVQEKQRVGVALMDEKWYITCPSGAMCRVSLSVDAQVVCARGEHITLCSRGMLVDVFVHTLLHFKTRHSIQACHFANEVEQAVDVEIGPHV